MIGADRFGPDSPGDALSARACAPQADRGRRGDAGLPRRTRRCWPRWPRAAIVAVPSRWQEPFGLTALEAMACGAALLCCPPRRAAEVDGRGRRADRSRRPGAVAAAIVALAQRPARRAALAGRPGRARAGCSTLPAVGAGLDALRAEALAAWSRGRPAPYMKGPAARPARAE